MSRFNPFGKVNGKYGAPMGRPSDDPANFRKSAPKSTRARRISWTDGDYDQGGAYWGFGLDVWAVWQRDLAGDVQCRYVRAVNRTHAIAQVLSQASYFLRSDFVNGCSQF